MARGDGQKEGEKVVSKSVFVDLFEIRAWIEHDGVKASVSRYYTKFTGQNYLPHAIPVDQEDIKTPDGRRKYSISRLFNRVAPKELMQVRRPGLSGDQPNHVSRSIYFLEGDLEKAREMVTASMDEVITRMRNDAEKLYQVWHSRPRPNVKEAKTLFFVSTGKGCTIREGYDMDFVEAAVLREVGTDAGISDIREATEADIEYVRGMGGNIPKV